MGQTLENGIYLPSEGERNCYDGLASNWRSVDTNIGYISALRQAIAGALTRKIVTELPTEDIDPNCIYMILKTTPQTNNVYNEWMYISNAWEFIGDTQLDLSDYYTKQEVNQLPAVASGVTSTKVGNYDAHIANGDIHVTTADKTKWNNGVTQSYVFRYSSTALVASSTNSNSLLDNTDNLKVGDKVIDSNGVLFSITAIDTANSTFTIGTALVDLALDANVVHTSGDETVGGIKNFSDETYIKSLNFTNEVASPSSSSSAIMPIVTTVTYTDQTASKSARINLRITASGGDKSLYPHENNQYALGLTSRKWSEVHATTYYYGSSDTEFSDKFVTTDTAQTIASNKTFVGSQYFKDNNVQYFGIDFSKGTAPSAYTARCTYFSPLTGGGSTYQSSNGLVGCAVNSDNVVTTFMHAIKNTAGATTRTSFVLYYDTDNDKRSVSTNGDFLPILSGQGIGNSTNKWSTINGLNPSSLSMPDLANGIDISSYIDLTQTSQYTAPANGYIAICGYASSTSAILLKDHDYDFAMTARAIISTNLGQATYLTIPVVKNHVYDIICNAVTTLSYAKFYPCQGNV